MEQQQIVVRKMARALARAGLADKAPRMSGEQAKTRATWPGRTAELMWDCLTYGDPE